ncbi:MAG: hypothetical protein KDD67_00760 [Ignavibacteriae bacterium]|nr:hypothetical protein [Ignavibacteriota bacterium]MCB9216040.1 hypothetical protein [Ignavibacteria bacterium]
MSTQPFLLPTLLISLIFLNFFELSAQHVELDVQADSLHFSITTGSSSEPFFSQRLPNDIFENRTTQLSSIQTFVTNYGIIGLNPAPGNAGFVWPKGSGKAYMFGGGFWFGTKKQVSGTSAMKEYTVLGYNPNTGRSWFVPGPITQPYLNSGIDTTYEGILNNRLYISTDYRNGTGIPYDTHDVANGGSGWPVWHTQEKEEGGKNHYFGDMIFPVGDRTLDNWPKGPVMISDQDMVAVYKDTDLSRYEIGEQEAMDEGYPIGLQVEQRLYSWGTGPLSDVLIIRYAFINVSNDTLFDSFFAPVYDVDIGAAGNDRMRTVIVDPDEDTLDLGVMWSESTGGDQGYGYLGFDFIQSPAVYEDGEKKGFIRNDKIYFRNEEQLGLHSFRNWVIDIDPVTHEEKYPFISTEARDGDNGAGDKRMALSTGPFNMLPGDTAVIALGIVLANPRGSTPSGEWEDMESLIEKDLAAQRFWDTFTRTNSVEDAWERLLIGPLDLR